jgi:hypothetical protein
VVAGPQGCGNRLRSELGRERRFGPRPPTSGLASIPDILLLYREPPLRARSRLWRMGATPGQGSGYEPRKPAKASLRRSSAARPFVIASERRNRRLVAGQSVVGHAEGHFVAAFEAATAGGRTASSLRRASSPDAMSTN